MAVPTDRDSFIQYCLRKLGEPVIKVNVALEQADDRVDEGLQRFHERHYNGSEETFILYKITDKDVKNGFIVLPRDMVSVTNVFLPTPNAGLFSVEYQLQLENLFSTSLVSNYGDLTYYYMTQANVTLINRIFTPERQYAYNPISNRLVIAGGLVNTKVIAGGIVIRGYKKVYGDKEEERDQGDFDKNNVIANIWSERWLQNYVTALIKKQWGQNLSKYQSLQLLGGVTMNGMEIAALAEVEIKELEQELYDTYETPPIFIMA